MLALHEEDIICDFVEYYHITNIYDYDVLFVVTLFFGLREDSRIKKRYSKDKQPLEVLILAYLSDIATALLHLETRKAFPDKKIAYPNSLYDMITGKQKKEEKQEIMTFTSGEDFENFRKNKRKDK